MSTAIRTLVAAVLLVVTASPRADALTIENGDFVSLVEELRDLSFTSGSNLYVPPTAGEQTQFRNLAASLLAGNVAAAEVQAAALNYEVVQFTDDATNQIYLGVREILNLGQQTLGWGSYFVNQNFSSDVLVQTPHPRFDSNSWDIAARVFRQAEARGFMMAGAHRSANGGGTADVAHLTNTIFHQVHEVWNGLNAETVPWQIHGFDLDNHPSFPAGTDVVFSNGDGGVSPEVIALDGQFTGQGFLGHAYNTLNVADPLNVAVNGVVPGTTFAGLGATTNVQGIYSRGLGGEFVHIEMEQSIRFDELNRQLASDAIAAAIIASSANINSAVPEPGSWISLGGLLLLVRRRATRERQRTARLSAF